MKQIMDINKIVTASKEGELKDFKFDKTDLMKLFEHCIVEHMPGGKDANRPPIAKFKSQVPDNFMLEAMSLIEAFVNFPEQYILQASGWAAATLRKKVETKEFPFLVLTACLVCYISGNGSFILEPIPVVRDAALIMSEPPTMQ